MDHQLQTLSPSCRLLVPFQLLQRIHLPVLPHSSSSSSSSSSTTLSASQLDHTRLHSHIIQSVTELWRRQETDTSSFNSDLFTVLSIVYPFPLASEASLAPPRLFDQVLLQHLLSSPTSRINIFTHFSSSLLQQPSVYHPLRPPFSVFLSLFHPSHFSLSQAKPLLQLIFRANTSPSFPLCPFLFDCLTYALGSLSDCSSSGRKRKKKEEGEGEEEADLCLSGTMNMDLTNRFQRTTTEFNRGNGEREGEAETVRYSRHLIRYIYKSSIRSALMKENSSLPTSSTSSSCSAPITEAASSPSSFTCSLSQLLSLTNHALRTPHSSLLLSSFLSTILSSSIVALYTSQQQHEEIIEKCSAYLKKWFEMEKETKWGIQILVDLMGQKQTERAEEHLAFKLFLHLKGVFPTSTNNRWFCIHWWPALLTHLSRPQPSTLPLLRLLLFSAFRSNQVIPIFQPLSPLAEKKEQGGDERIDVEMMGGGNGKRKLEEKKEEDMNKRARTLSPTSTPSCSNSFDSSFSLSLSPSIGPYVTIVDLLVRIKTISISTTSVAETNLDIQQIEDTHETRNNMFAIVLEEWGKAWSEEVRIESVENWICELYVWIAEEWKGETKDKLQEFMRRIACDQIKKRDNNKILIFNLFQRCLFYRPIISHQPQQQHNESSLIQSSLSSSFSSKTIASSELSELFLAILANALKIYQQQRKEIEEEIVQLIHSLTSKEMEAEVIHHALQVLNHILFSPTSSPASLSLVRTVSFSDPHYFFESSLLNHFTSCSDSFLLLSCSSSSSSIRLLSLTLATALLSHIFSSSSSQDPHLSSHSSSSAESSKYWIGEGGDRRIRSVVRALLDEDGGVQRKGKELVEVMKKGGGINGEGGIEVVKQVWKMAVKIVEGGGERKENEEEVEEEEWIGAISNNAVIQEILIQFLSSLIQQLDTATTATAVSLAEQCATTLLDPILTILKSLSSSSSHFQPHHLRLLSFLFSFIQLSDLSLHWLSSSTFHSTFSSLPLYPLLLELNVSQSSQTSLFHLLLFRHFPFPSDQQDADESGKLGMNVVEFVCDKLLSPFSTVRTAARHMLIEWGREEEGEENKEKRRKRESVRKWIVEKLTLLEEEAEEKIDSAGSFDVYSSKLALSSIRSNLQ